MFARTADELRRFLTENPEDPPSIFIDDQSFASECYDTMTIRELKAAFNRDPDTEECEKWNLSAQEWRENIEIAFVGVKARELRARK